MEPCSRFIETCTKKPTMLIDQEFITCNNNRFGGTDPRHYFTQNAMLIQHSDMTGILGMSSACVCGVCVCVCVCVRVCM